MKKIIACVLGIAPVTFASHAGVLYYEKYGNCDGVYLNIPASGCGTSADKLDTITTPSKTDKNFDGFYLNGEKLIDVDGTIYGDISKLGKAGVLGENSVQLSATYYDTGTVYIEYDSETGEIVEKDNPAKGHSTCDAVKIDVYPHRTDQANTYGVCSSSKDGTAVITLYYKKGEGYFTDAARTHRVNDATYSGGTNLNIPTNPGYRLRGFFTSKWPGLVTSQSTTVGAAYIALNSSNNIQLGAPNWVVSTNTSCGKGDYYPMPLCAGWAKECADSSICNLEVKNSTAAAMERGDVTYTIGQCKTGTLSGQGANATCDTTPPPSSDPTRINVRHYNSSGNVSTAGCDISDTNKITLLSTVYGETISAYKYKGISGDNTMFAAGSKVPCKIGNGGFEHGSISGNIYTVELEPVQVTDPGSGNDSDKEQVSVTLKTSNGNETIVVDKGTNLGDYAPETREDGGEFVGWYQEGKGVSSASRYTVVGSSDEESVVYNAAYACPEGKSMNAYGTCVDTTGETEEYIDRSGNPVQPSSLNCWRQENGQNVNYCYWKVNITFHSKPNGSNLIVNDQNDGLVLNCNGGSGCKNKSGQCAAVNGVGTCTHIYTPTSNDYYFRGYYYNIPSGGIVTESGTKESGAYNNFFPKNLNSSTISILGHAVIVMNDTPVPVVGTGIQTTAPIDIDVYGGWARKCDTSSQHSYCQVFIGNLYFGNTSQGLGKGDVKYGTSCDDGYSLAPGTDNTYRPICERESGAINVSYSVRDQYGLNINCPGLSATCESGEKLTLIYQDLINSSCGSGYTLKYLSTNRGLYTAAKPVSCSANEFGQCTENGACTINVAVCDAGCTIGSSISHGRCVAVTPQSAIVNGSEVVNNLWENCTKIECDEGYGAWRYSATNVQCLTKSEITQLMGL